MSVTQPGSGNLFSVFGGFKPHIMNSLFSKSCNKNDYKW